MNIRNQQGVGMIEVLVALVILAIGVLGFSALQLRAMQATAEATDRTMAMNLARDLAERIRINRLGLSDYVTALNTEKTENGCLGSGSGYKPVCDKTKMANYDATEALSKATEKGQDIVMQDCIGTSRTCIYIAWGKTQIKERDAQGKVTKVDISKCVNLQTGIYEPDTQCIVMEAF